jgi:beta-glucosidase
VADGGSDDSMTPDSAFGGTSLADRTASATGVAPFPAAFLWGAATSAYQIEGSTDADGRGTSIWDTFFHTPGRVRNGDTGDVAVDHYRLMEDDVVLMARLGLRAYRFSVAWPRVLPQGRGAVNQSGLDFYRRLVDRLLESGIEPLPTLYHWDLPEALQREGGWSARSTAQAFAAYAAVVGGALGDRVTRFLTLNEPWCSAFLGYASGVHAPGIRDPESAVRATHHLLLAHGLGVKELRAAGDSEAGITLNLFAVSPATDSEEDRAAAQAIDGLQNRLFLDPILKGSYPDDVLASFHRICDLSVIQPDDLQTISAPIDVLGVNYYTRHTVTAAPNRPPAGVGSQWVGAENIGLVEPDGAKTAMGWPVDADGLVEVLGRVSRDYDAPPILITENGAAYDDVVDEQGAVDDSERISYLDAHVAAIRRAMDHGVDVRGYFVWSLLDNFEWAEGYSKRFGIVYVDFPDQRRVLKASALWYRDLISRQITEDSDDET